MLPLCYLICYKTEGMELHRNFFFRLAGQRFREGLKLEYIFLA